MTKLPDYKVDGNRITIDSQEPVPAREHDLWYDTTRRDWYEYVQGEWLQTGNQTLSED